ncbi:hypothetical protein sS8_0004 [Methylocaldum marinum]|uniref:Uncharacterized protein n=1 Tax=Methylocaldum marinum TaxID=1432792 RepID=A0A286T5H5_9GAMM|nr:hypothetical protein [Methylocaldum marinum]BBA31974.1 hypothetical protein sS8_0004 [Methylocaldum marinum]
MESKIICTSNAENWFYCCKGSSNGTQKVDYFRLSVWATYENGEPIGLLSLKKENTFYLAKPSVEDGFYIHWNELDEDQQKEALEQGRISPAQISAWERE